MKTFSSYFYFCIFCLSAGVFDAPAHALDCNQNGIEDDVETVTSDLTLLFSRSLSFGSFLTGAVIDINLDGKKDAVYVTRPLAPFEVHISTLRSRQFVEETAVFQPFGQQFTPHSVRALDVDGNSFLDLEFVGEERSTLAFNQGDTTFVYAQPEARPGLPRPSDPGERVTTRSFDINQDGRTDEVRVTDLGYSFLLRNAEGNLDVSQTINYLRLRSSDCSGTAEEPEGNLLPPVDLDNDGDLDLPTITGRICTESSSPSPRDLIGFFENLGNGMFREISGPRSVGSLRFLSYSDVDNDSFSDVVLANTVRNINNVTQGTFFSSGIAIAFAVKDPSTQDVNKNQVPDSCERAVPGDFDGDRRGDYTIVRKGVRPILNWLTLSESKTEESKGLGFGLSAYDEPYAGDFNGDGRMEMGVVRGLEAELPGFYGLYWYNALGESSVAAEETQWGLPGDIPQTGYFDSDQKLDRAVVRSSNGFLYWYIRGSLGTNYLGLPWGIQGDVIYAGDRNGDELDELIVTRDFLGGLYWFSRSVNGEFSDITLWGLSGDTPLPPSDLDGDGKVDYAIARSGAGNLLDIYVIKSSTNTAEVTRFGLQGDIPYFSYLGGENSPELSVYRKAPFLSDTEFGFGFENQHFAKSDSGFIRSRYWGVRNDILILPNGSVGR